MDTAPNGHARLLNFIDGEWVDTPDGSSVNVDPSDARRVLGTVVKSGTAEVLRAIESAKRAQKSWRRVPAPKRGAILLEAMRLMEQRKPLLARALTLEEGKTYADSLGEVQKSINVLEFFSGEGRRFTGETIPSEFPRTFAYTIRSPLGVCAAITPWNFPVCIPTWKIAPALVAGNAVVFKPATATPWTAMLLVEIFVDAGLPRGVLNLIYGSGGAVGQQLVDHPDVAALSFTGSNEIGTKLYEGGSRLLKKVQCEMGGKNPVIVLDDADLELAAVATAQGAFGSSGQRCTATSRAIVTPKIADAFVERVVALAKGLKVGPGIESGVDMGPAVDEAQMKTVLSFHERAKKEGLASLVGGRRLSEGPLEHGYFTAPTVYDHVPATSALAQEEIFGPVLSVIRVKDVEEAFAVANGVRYGLSSSIFTRDVARCMEYADEIETGMLHVNSATVGGEAHLPFGGVKATGVGQREMGPTAIDFYSEWKTVYIDYTGAKRDSKVY
jgi:aldehyde dehydrogenase (NAD+)